MRDMKPNAFMSKGHFSALRYSMTLVLITFLTLLGNQLQAQCNCEGNLLTNPGFENGTNGYYASTSFYTGTGFEQCGSSSNGFINATSTAGWVWQGKPATPGASYFLSVYAGTHNPSGNHFVRLAFYDSNGNYISSAKEDVNFDVDGQGGALQLYTLQSLAPSNAATVQFEGYANTDYLKLDEICLSESNVQDFSFDCNEGKALTLHPLDNNGQGNSSITIPNSNEVYKYVVEIVYKGSYNPGNVIKVKGDGVNYYLNRVVVDGSSSQVKVWRGEINANPSTITYTNYNNTNQLQSLLVYAFRNSGDGNATAGQFTAVSGYHSTETFNIGIPTASSPRDATLQVPISEVTYDCRVLDITVQPQNNGSNTGSAISYRFVGNPNDWSPCCIEVPSIELANIPGNANNLKITINSPTGSSSSCPDSGPGIQNGQSYVIAGAVTVQTSCCSNITDGGQIGSNQVVCTGNTPDPLTNIQSPTGGEGTIEYMWIKSTTTCDPPTSTNDPNWQEIIGANGDNYAPGPITQTTCYIRCSRRVGCETWDGESNVVTLEVSNCTPFECPDNLVQNPSFEDGTNHWNWSGGNLTTGTYAAVFGSYSGHFQITNSSSNWFSQTIDEGTIQTGSTIELSVYAGTHNPSYYHQVGIEYFDDNWNYISGDYAEVNEILPSMSEYNIVSVVPAGATKINVSGGGTGDWIKTDGWCVTVGCLPLTGDITGDTNICNGEQTTLTASAGNGIAPYTFTWSHNLGTGAVKTVSPSSTKTYSVTVSDANNCTTVFTQEVVVNAKPTLDAGADVDICSGLSVIISASASGGAQPYNYEWPNGSTGSSISVSPTSTTTYIVTVTDNNGCEDTDDVIVNVTDGPTVVASEDVNICEGDEATLTVDVSNIPTCGSDGSTTDYCDVLSGWQNWVESPSKCATYNDNYGGKLWSGSGQGESEVTLDCGEIVPAGTKIFVKAKKLNWYDWFSAKMKVRCSTNESSGYFTVNSSFSFDKNYYKEYEFTVSQSCRYIKISDVGNCAWNLDHIKFKKPDNYTGVTYEWFGPGIIGSNTGETVEVNAAGEYVVAVTSCDGCVVLDTVNVTFNTPVDADLGDDFVLCTDDGSVTLSTPFYSGATYEWRSNQSTDIIGTTNTLTVQPTIETEYTVTVKNGDCEDSDAVIVKVGPTVDAGDDIEVCADDIATITVDVTNIPNCGSEGSYTGHCDVLSGWQHWVESPSKCSTYNDNYGAKLWSGSGQGESEVTLDCGEIVPAGTKIYIKAKKLNWYDWTTSKMKIRCSTNETSGYTSVHDNYSFNDHHYKEYTFTLNTSCRYIKVSDIGNCAFNLDHIRYQKPSNYTGVTYEWTGPGIIGSTTTETIEVNVAGTYIVNVSSCDGCITSDTVQVTINEDVYADITEDVICTTGGPETLSTPIISGATYEWRSNQSTDIIGTTNTLTVQPTVETEYTVTVKNGDCEDSDVVLVKIGPSVTVSDDVTVCDGDEYHISSTVVTSAFCGVPGETDCEHTLVNQGGWLENPSASESCTDYAGTKLWTASGQGTSYITLDLGAVVPSGTSICIAMKKAHCNNSPTYNSNARISRSLSSSSGFIDVVSSKTFSNTSYVCFGYTLDASTQYIKISDNGECAFRVDYVQYTTPNTLNNEVVYEWSGPGIVSPTDGETIVVNAAGTYTLVVTDCNGCSASDEVVVNYNPAVVADAGADQTICDGESVTLTAAEVSGGSYLWTDIQGNVIGTTQSVTVAPSVETTYLLYVEKDGCEDSDDIVITVNESPSVTVSDDVTLCEGDEYHISSTVTDISSCGTPGETDCNHDLVDQGGWLENPNASESCVDYAGTKLWTASGQGTSYITLDLGSIVPSGTSICVAMKLEHCSNSSTSQSNAKIKRSLQSGSGYSTVISSATFSNNSYVCFGYTLDADTRYIRIEDNGECAFRVDYVQYTTPNTLDGAVTYAWSGPGIVGASNGETIVVNAAGTYTLVVTDCNGCTASDEVVVNYNPAVDAEAGADQTICEGESATLTATEVPGANYEWRDASGTIIGTTQSITVTPNTTESYILFVEKDGCEDSDDVVVTVEEKATVGDFVWYDANYNGLQDAGETGINGVEVSIYDATNDMLVESTTTANNAGNSGYYSFNVCKGDYYIQFGTVDNTIRTINVDTDDALNSDADQNTGQTETFTLLAGEVNNNYDAGFVSMADLELLKVVNDNTPNVGDVVTYTITVTNYGPNNAMNVAVNDNLPIGISNISNINLGGVNIGNDITWSGLSLAVGESVVLTYDATVLPITGTPGEYFNAAEVTDSDQYDPDSTPDNDDGDQSEDDEDNEELTPQSADLNLIKFVNDPTPNVGDIVTFTIRVTNEGPDDAINVKVEDVTPSGYSNVTEVSSYLIGASSVTPGIVTWEYEVASIPAGTSIDIIYTAEVNAPTAGVNFVNIAEITYCDQFDPDSTPDNGADTNGTGGIGSQDADDTQDPGDEDDGDDAKVTPQVADLNLTKTVNDANPNVGDIVTFTIRVTNEGPDDATSVLIEDAIPNGYYDIVETTSYLMFSIQNSNDYTYNTYAINTIPAGSFVDIVYTATVRAPESYIPNVPISYVNIARVMECDQFDPDSTPGNAADSSPGNGIGSQDPDDTQDPNDEDDGDDAEVDPQVADLYLVKTVSDNYPNVGDVITFYISIGNLSTDDATGVVVNDIIPNGYSSITNISNGGVLNGNVIEWTNLNVPFDGILLLTYNVTVEAPLAGVEYENVANIMESDQWDPDSTPGNDPDTDNDGNIGSQDDDFDQDPDDEDDADNEITEPQIADLELVKVVNDNTPNVGDIISYTVSVTNQGPNDASSVAVEDIIPNGLANISNISDGGTISNSVIDWTGLSIAVGETIILTYDAEVLAPGTGVSYFNVAQVTDSDQWDPDSTPDNDDGDQSEDDEDNEEVVPQVVDLQLIKQVDDKYPMVGESVTYTIRVSNLGPDKATFITVEDIVPNGLSNVTNITNGGTFNGSTITWNIGSIEVNGSFTVKYTATVNQPANGISFINLAEVTACDQYDSDSTPGNGADTNNNGLVGSVDNDDSQDPEDEDDGDDAIVIPTASLGDFVFYDENGNGLQDPSEIGIANVTIQLSGIDENGAIVTDFTTTDANGYYEFIDLIPGNYTVTFPTTAMIGGEAGVLTTEDVTGGDSDATDTNEDSDANEDTGVAESVTLISGENDPRIDAGYYVPASIGDYVWEDMNGDGIQDATESGIEGVEVSLSGTTGSGMPVSMTTTTDANGYYIFEGLAPGDYTVNFGLPMGYEYTTMDAGADDSVDSDADEVTGDSPLTTVVSGEDNETIDAGLYLPASLGDYVWEDMNGDGIQDATENGIAGVEVTLTGTTGSGDPVSATTTTDGTGYYEFTGLAPGDYVVNFGLPMGYEFTTMDAGADDSVDSDADEVTGDSPMTTLVSGEDNPTIDAGMYLPASISGYVLADTNNDDIGDTPIEGIIIDLVDEFGAVVATETTDENGYYEFIGVVPGDYTIVEVTEPGDNYQDVSDIDESVNANDPDGDDGAIPNDQIPVTVVSGESDEDNNFVEEELASIGDYVWLDANANGLQDADEVGIAEVEVTLKDAFGNPLQTTFTDEDGYYLFENLDPSDYIVDFEDLEGYERTIENVNGGNDDETTDDSDADENGESEVVTLFGGEDERDIDAGYYQLASLGDYAWYDLNENGIQDTIKDAYGSVIGLELPFEGAIVELYDMDDNYIASDTTDENGYYNFMNLVPNTYYVKFDATSYPFAGFDITLQNAGFDDAVDSDFDTLTLMTDDIVLISGQDDDTNDLGVKSEPVSSLNACICKDNATNSEDGQFDETIFISGTPGAVWTIVEQDGMYLSSSPQPPMMPVAVPLGTSFEVTSLGMYEYSFVHVDAIGYSVTLTNGVETLMISNMCEYPNVNFDEIETPLCLYDEPVELTSNPNDVGLTTYFVVNESMDTVYLTNNILDPSMFEVGEYQLVVEFTPEDTMKCVDRYIQEIEISIFDNCLAAIGDTTWIDVNADGIYTDNEFGLMGIPVMLLDSSNQPVSKDAYGNDITMIFTDDNGYYEFTNLIPGDYKVQFGTIDDFIRSPQNVGGDDAIDSDADVSTGITGVYSLAQGEFNTTVDAGFYQLGTIGDYVWLDANGNGIQDPLENGVQGIVVNLLDGMSQPTGMTTTTDVNGFYQFTNLLPGDYQVQFVIPSGNEFTQANVTTPGANDSNDSDANPLTGLSPIITLVSDEENPTIDAGIYAPLTLGDLVWNDINNNGVFDEGEMPISFVDLALWKDLNNDNQPDVNTGRTALTNADGIYLFENLEPGDYIVQIVPSNFDIGGSLIGFKSSMPGVSPSDPDDDIDNDDNGFESPLGIGVVSKTISLRSASEPITDGDDDMNTNLTVDFGFFDDARIGDYVWRDMNADGIQNPSEKGINGVTVYLYDANNPATPIDTTMTAENPNNATMQGYYIFDGLVPGDYFVKFVKPAGYILTEANAGNDMLDSDVDDSNGPFTTMTITVGPGEDYLTLDAGFYQAAVVGDYVWLDNMDGPLPDSQDPMDTGVNGITVNLYTTDNLTVPYRTLVTSTSPNGVDGWYLFTGVPVGEYLVEFVKPSQYSFVVPNVGNDMIDSDVVDFFTGRTLTFQVFPSDTILDIDAGLRLPPLPVDWLYIRAEWEKQKDINLVSWATAAEINADKFIVERSYENEGFAKIGTVDAVGNSTEIQEYEFEDPEISRNGKYYYRLKQVDIDGSFEYSDIVVVDVFREGEFDTRIYPNPAYSDVNIEIFTSEKVQAQAMVLDAAGKLVSNNIINEELQVGMNNYTLPVSDLPRGTYLIRITTGDKVYNHKLIVLK